MSIRLGINDLPSEATVSTKVETVCNNKTLVVSVSIQIPTTAIYETGQRMEVAIVPPTVSMKRSFQNAFVEENGSNNQCSSSQSSNPTNKVPKEALSSTNSSPSSPSTDRPVPLTSSQSSSTANKVPEALSSTNSSPPSPSTDRPVPLTSSQSSSTANKVPEALSSTNSSPPSPSTDQLFIPLKKGSIKHEITPPTTRSKGKQSPLVEASPIAESVQSLKPSASSETSAPRKSSAPCTCAVCPKHNNDQFGKRGSCPNCRVCAKPGCRINWINNEVKARPALLLGQFVKKKFENIDGRVLGEFLFVLICLFILFNYLTGIIQEVYYSNRAKTDLYSIVYIDEDGEDLPIEKIINQNILVWNTPLNQLTPEHETLKKTALQHQLKLKEKREKQQGSSSQ
jgi:hypothetical protein